jgi:thioredoxin-related protein
MKHILMTCAAVLALNADRAAADDGWTTDYQAAMKQAADSGKDLLIDFTGSDWCGWCIKLKEEVFSHDAFKNGVKDIFVTVEIDFPKDKSKLSGATLEQNQRLGERYAVRGYPTIMLCDAAGRPYAATGYQEGGPERYIEHLGKLRARKAARDEAFAAAEKAADSEKAAMLVAALDAMELDDALVAGFYGGVAEQIAAADPEDKTGFTARAAARKRFGEFQERLQEFGSKQDHEGALGLVGETLKQGGLGKDETQQVMLVRAVILAEQRKFSEALKAVDEARAFHKDSPMDAMIVGFRQRIEEEAGKQDGAPAAEDAQ